MKTLTLALAIMFVGVFSVIGQEKVLTETEFKTMQYDTCEKTKAVAHSFTEVIEKYFDESKPPYYSYVSLKRYVPQDRVWTIAGTKDSTTENKYEEIRIGRTSYSRKGLVPWKVQELGFSGLYSCESLKPRSGTSGPGNGTGDSDSTSARFKTVNEYKYLGKQKVGEKLVDLYVDTKILTITTSTHETQSTVKMSFWISSEGLYVRKEKIETARGTVRWTKEVTDYEYDPKDLKIEAPVIK